MRKTATGMPATALGYWFGRLLCKLGRHKVAGITAWGFTEGPRGIRHGRRVTRWCIRDCQWGEEQWEDGW